MRKYAIGIIFLLLFEVSPASAQSTTELAQFNFLCEKAEEYIVELPDSSNFYLDKAYDLSSNIGVPYYTGHVLFLKAKRLSYDTDLVNALILMRESVNILSEYQDSTEYIEAEMTLGDLFLELDDYLRALIQYRKVIEIGEDRLKEFSDEFQDEVNFIRARTYAKIAFIYDELGDYNTELNNLMKSTKISYKIDTKEADRLRVSNLINLGFVHYNLGNYDLAEQFVIRNLDEKRRFDMSYSEGQNYQILGLIAEGKGKYPLAFAYLDHSDKKLRKYKIRRELIRNEFYRAKIYHSMKDYEGAKAKLLEIEDRFVKNFSDNELSEFYSVLTEVYFNLNEFEKAYAASRKALEYQKRRVFTYNSEVVDEFVGFMEAKSVENKDEIVSLEEKQNLERAQLRNQKKELVNFWVRSFFIGFLVCLILIAAILYFSYKRNIKRKIELEERVEENKVLFKEVHHRVKNNFQIITSMLNLQERSSEKEFEVLKEAKKRIEAMALVHNLLYKEETQDGNLLKFKGYVKELCMQVLEASVPETKKIKIEFSGTDMNMDLEMAVPISLILNELITNAVDHAFPDKNEGKINVALRRIDDHKFNLSVSDNGIGFDINLEDDPVKGEMGIFLVQILTNQLEGELKIVKNEGTIVSIDFTNMID